MRKLVFLILLLALFMTFSAVAATPVDTLSNLAQYYPEDAPFFAVVRTDDGFIETLDGLLGRVTRNVDLGVPPGISLNLMLDLVSQQAFNGDFDSAVRSWLGNSVAFGLLSTENLVGAGYDEFPEILLAAEINSKEALLGVFEQLIGRPLDEAFEIDEMGPYTVLQTINGTGVLAASDEVAFIALSLTDLPLGLEGTLAESDAYTEVVNGLPTGDYNALMYLDTAALNKANLANMQEMMGALPPYMETMMSVGGSIAVGFTVLGGDTLALDFAQSAAGTQAFAAELDMTMVIPSPIDPTFAQYIPADAPLVIHGTDFGPTLAAGFDNLRALDDYIKANGGLSNMMNLPLSPNEALLVDQFQFSIIGSLTNLGFAGMTGLNLEREVLPWMTGDYAVFLRAVEPEFAPFWPDFAFIIQADNPDGPTTLVNNIADALDAYGLPYFDEEDVTGVALPWLRAAADMPEVTELDFVLATDGSILAFGTRAGVEAAFSGGNSLAEDPAYIHSMDYFLTDTQQVSYFGFNPTVLLLDKLAQLPYLSRYDREDIITIRKVLSIFESATITAVASDGGINVGRMVLTLASNPIPLPEIDMDATAEVEDQVMPTRFSLPTPTFAPTEEPMEEEAVEEAVEEPVEAATELIPTLPPTWTPTPTATVTPTAGS